MNTEKQIVRTTAGLRDMLFDELDALCNNKSTPAQANAKARVAHEICHSAELDLSVRQHRANAAMNGETAIDRAVPGSLRLGRAA